MKRTLLCLTIFAIAMAYLEAAVVVYIRELYYPANIRQIFPPFLLSGRDIAVELAREVSTVVMMLSVAFLAFWKNPTKIFAAFVFQFGVWDIFYYIWLKVTIGWPVSLGEWDILFLIPWAWLGPWICPVLISLLFVLWGGLVLKSGQDISLRRPDVFWFVTGSLLALAAFLQPALQVFLKGGIEAFRSYQPGGFWWWLFVPGYLVMSYGLLRGVLFRRSSLGTTH